MRKTVLIAVAALSTLAACKQQEAVTATTARGGKKPEVLIEEVRQHEFDCETMSLRASTNFTASGKSNSFKTVVRMRKDSAIWLSINKASIEAARVLITPDSVKFINRLEKQFFIGDYSKVDSLFQVELDFDDLQAVLMGNSVGIEMPERQDRDERREERQDDKEERKELRSEFRTELREGKEDLKKVKRQQDRERYKSKKKEEKEDWKDERKEMRDAIGRRTIPIPPIPVVSGERAKPSRIRVTEEGGMYYVSTWRAKKLQRIIENDKPIGTDEIAYSAWFHPETYKPMKLSVYDIAARKRMQAVFSEFQEVNGQLLPHKTEMSIQADQQAEIEMTYSKVKVNEPLKFSFRIPKKYAQIY